MTAGHITRYTEGPFTVLRHDNGAVACIDEDPGRTLACLSVRIEGGSGADPVGKSGLAHLFEHLLVTGTPSTGRDRYMAAVQDEGAHCRAVTGVSWTTFSTICAPDALPDILRLEADRFSNTISFLDVAVLEREKRVVRNERALRVDSMPYGDALENLFVLLYGDSPFGRVPVGIDGEIASITLEDCAGYFTRGHAAGRVSIAVSGNIAGGAIDALTRLMDAFPAGGGGSQGPQPPPSTGGVREVSADLPAKLYFGYLLPPADQGAFDRARLGSYLLGKGEGSYLRRELVDADKAILAEVKVKTLTRVDTWSVGVIEAVPLSGVSVSDARAEVHRVLDGLDASSVDPLEVERAKGYYRRSWYREDDTTRGRADGLSLALLRAGRPARYLEELDPATTGGPELVRDALASWRSDRIVGEVVYT